MSQLFVILPGKKEDADFGFYNSGIRTFPTLDDAVKSARHGETIYEAKDLQPVGKMSFKPFPGEEKQ